MKTLILPCIALCFSLIVTSAYTAVDGTQLPRISDGAFSITPEEEYKLGHTWVRSLRGTSNLSDDPIIKSYVEDLVWSMVPHSQLSDKRLTVLVINKAVPNAFAAPGGILGFHTGIILAAESEAELASVVAHELAHLSQRHYAARVEAQKQNTPLMVAGVLGSILVASADGEAGSAALISTLAGQQQLILAHSRQNEREADYIGMQTLTATGYSASAMPKMFLRLMSYNRFSEKGLEYLQTHPVSESRIAESQSRAHGLTGAEVKQFTTTADFPLIKARLSALHSANPRAQMEQIAEERKSNNNPLLAYAELMNALQADELDRAQAAADAFPQDFKDRLLVTLTLAELALKREEPHKAIELAQLVADILPGHYAANMILARAYLLAENADKASRILSEMSNNRPEDEQVWYWFSEAEGLANKPVSLHLARTEYFLLTGRIDSARKQVQFAKRDRNLSANDLSRIEEIERKVKDISLDMKAL